MLSDRKGKNVITRPFSGCKTARIQEKTLFHLREEKIEGSICPVQLQRYRKGMPQLDRLDHRLQRSFPRATAEKGLARWKIKGTTARVKGGHGSLISLK